MPNRFFLRWNDKKLKDCFVPRNDVKLADFSFLGMAGNFALGIEMESPLEWLGMKSPTCNQQVMPRTFVLVYFTHKKVIQYL